MNKPYEDSPTRSGLPGQRTNRAETIYIVDNERMQDGNATTNIKVAVANRLKSAQVNKNRPPARGTMKLQQSKSIVSTVVPEI